MHVKRCYNGVMHKRVPRISVLYILVACANVFFVSFASATECPQFSRNLKEGSKGDDVRSLQEYLQGQGAYSEGDGVFGSKTTEAVQFFQNSMGLEATGIVDEETRAIIQEDCAGAGSLSVTAKITPKPEVGNAPLSVTYSIFAPAGDQFEYALSFGDDTKQVPFTCKKGAPCEDSYTVTHVYQLPGTYKAELFRGYGESDLSVNVGGSQSKTPVSFSIIEAKDPNPPQPSSLCREWFNGCVICTRKQRGEALDCPKRTCFGALKKPECRSTIYVNKLPKVTVTGPTSFVDGIPRTYVITATDPEKKTLMYGFDWGMSGKPAKTPATFSKNNKGTITYKSPGTYTITAFAKDPDGGIGKAKLTIEVRDSYLEETCTKEYVPVCGVKDVCTTLGAQQTCIKQEKTYSNECLMRHDRAKKVRSGGC